MYGLIRPLLFKLQPETAHAFTLQLLRLGGLPAFAPLLQGLFSAPQKPVTAFGLAFKNPVGLAAGYDKDAQAINGLAALGFGHVEVGTVTLRPQAGNPLPRVFRLPEDCAVINRMGFPGKGADFVARQLRNHRRQTLLGVNLGKNKDTPLEQAAEDYIALMRVFAPLADYLTINISSPNTVGLRRLQGRDMLESLLGELARERNQVTLGRGGRTPMLVKIAPDLSDDELQDAVGVILNTGMDGIIATNTTLQREGLQGTHQGETGGLSGRPLRALSDSVLEKVVALVNGKIPVIGVGGIITPDDAKKKIDLGATLVQVYTGLIYAGPGLVREIIRQG
jgi:dihydroorotate dehydrogenase